jgi:DNA-binding YbaB/EbfC family protein
VAIFIENTMIASEKIKWYLEEEFIMFKGGNMGNMQGMMKKVQKMQADMAKLQEDLKSRVLETTAGGGVIKIEVNGNKEIVNLKIDQSAVDPDDVEMLEDLILTAVNDAMKQVDEVAEKEMAKITGGMKMPGMF